MISDSTLRRIRWHADLDQLPGVPTNASSVSSCLVSDGIDIAALERALADFVLTLEALNHELNGPMPSERIAAEAPTLPVALVYAITEVIRMLRERQARAAPEGKALGLAAWRAETAWSAVLAGDIDNIQDHLAEEEVTR